MNDNDSVLRYLGPIPDGDGYPVNTAPPLVDRLDGLAAGLEAWPVPAGGFHALGNRAGVIFAVGLGEKSLLLRLPGVPTDIPAFSPLPGWMLVEAYDGEEERLSGLVRTALGGCELLEP
ncbi:MAG: hypothetical protein ABI838_00210 [Chloroflexota bacterium]